MRRCSLQWLLPLVFISFSVCLIGCEVPTEFQHCSKIVLKANPKPGEIWPKSSDARIRILENMKITLQKRFLALTGTPTHITTDGDDKLVVELHGIQSPNAALSALLDNGRLDFYYLKNVSCPKNPHKKWRMEPSPGEQKSYIFTRKGRTLNSSKAPDEQKILTEVVGIPKVKPILTSVDILQNAKSTFSAANMPIVEIEFNERGTQTFSKFSRSHVGEILAIFYDGKLLTAPTIKSVIIDGKAEISGFTSLREAMYMAKTINNGTLPVHLKVVEVCR